MKKSRNRKYYIRKVLDYAGALFLALFLLFLWQLYRGPIAVPFLKPYIIKALNHDDSEFQVTLDSVNIELVRSIKPINIIANNVSYRKNDGSFVISAPKTSVSFSLNALLHGVVAPSTISVNNPTVYIFTTYGIGDAKKEDINQIKLEYYFDGFETFIERFNSDDKSYSESYINNIDINNAEVEFHEVDLGRKWVLSDLNYRFDRHFTNIQTSFSALVKLTDKVATVGLDAEFKPSNNKLALQFYFSDLNPGEVVDNFVEIETVQNLYKANLPLSGKIDAVINFSEVFNNSENIIDSIDSIFENVRFEFEGGAGNIQFADKEEYKYQVSSFMLGGSLDASLDNLKIENAKFDLGEQQADLTLDVSGFKNYFLNKTLEDAKITIKAKVDNLPLDELYKLWPRYIAEKAWLWVEDSIYGGEAVNAEFVFDFAYDEKSKMIAFKNLDGSSEVRDSNLNYLKGMPDIKNIYGKVMFSPTDLKVNIDKGVSDGVIMTGGHVILSELDQEDNFADISIEAEGSISNALKLIDNPPLGYASEMGLNTDIIEGNAETKLGLKFELKEDLKPEEVNVDVKAKLFDVKIPDIIKGKNLTSKELNLNVTNKGMLVIGNAEIDGIPLKLDWNENFNDKAYKSRYKISFIYDEEVSKKLDLNSDFIKAPYISGSAVVEADITSYDDKKMEISLNGDLTKTKLNYSFVGLKKAVGQKSNLTAKILLDDDKITSINGMNLTMDDFALKSNIVLDKNQAVKTIDITEVTGPKTSAKAKIEFANTKAQKIKVNISGNSYDISSLFESEETRGMRAMKPPKPVEDNWEKDIIDTDINIAVNNLWTNKKVAIKNFAGSASLAKNIGIQEAHVIGNYVGNPGSFIKLDYEPHINNEHMLSLESNDAGNTLKVLHIYDNMQGGKLDLKGRRTPDKKIVGHAKIRKFSVHNTPVLAKILTVASFTGMVNLLTGEGMAFSHFDAPFTYSNQIISVNEAKAFGNVLGITAGGTYDRYYEELNFKGMIAPAYSINTFIGKIPLVGNLLSGKDGTVFAANYEVTGDIEDPRIRYNPLSALSPNSLKELGSKFGGTDD